MSDSATSTKSLPITKGFGLSTAGYKGQPGHYYAHGREWFVREDPCIYGCGAVISWNGGSAPEGIDPFKGCPKNPEWPAYVERVLNNDLKETDNMHRLIISAPFGNYIQPKNATATIGTFTLQNRPGRFKQILKTVRYYPSLGAWTNKIGLRNPGIDSLIGKDLKGKILSIHGFNQHDWVDLLHDVNFLDRPLALELNFSCPNVTDEKFDYELICTKARRVVPCVIVKIPPINYQTMIFEANLAGVSIFHCTNTLPMPNGGMSGKPLKKFSLDAVANVRRLIPSCTIIGGGGVTSTKDIDDYVAAGANHVAIGSGLFNPFRAVFGVRRLADYAAEKCR